MTAEGGEKEKLHFQDLDGGEEFRETFIYQSASCFFVWNSSSLTVYQFCTAVSFPHDLPAVSTYIGWNPLARMIIKSCQTKTKCLILASEPVTKTTVDIARFAPLEPHMWQ